MSDPQPKTKKLSLSDLDGLSKAGVIPADQLPTAQKVYRETLDWHNWIQRLTGVLGLLFLLAGTMFFFASNWKAMSPLVRFGLLEGAVVLAVLVAVWQGINTTIGQASLMAATLLTGILLAVFGQVYQTGADAYEVYALWAILTLAWVFGRKSLGLWTMWIVVAQTAICLYFGQVWEPTGTPWAIGFVALGVFNLAALVIWEIRSNQSGDAWIQQDWFRSLLLAAGMIWLSFNPIHSTIRNFNLETAAGIGIIVWIFCSVATLFYYYRIRPNVAAFGISLVTVSITLAFAAARLIGDELDDIGGWFLISLLSLLIFGGAATVLVRFNQSIKQLAS